MVSNILKTRFFSFISIGALDTILDMIFFSALIFIFGKSPEKVVVFNIISFSIFVILGFILNGKYTFKDEFLSLKKFIKYYTTSSIGMILNTIIVSVLMIYLNFMAPISKIITACIIVFYNYTMARKYIYSEANHEKI